MDRQKRKKRKKILKIRRDSPIYILRIFWHRYRKNFSARNLVFIAREIDLPEIQKSALREFLTRGNLTFDDFYRVLGLPKEVLRLDPKLENNIWKQCFDLCTPDNLRELISLGETKAAEELFRRIDRKSMSMSKAKQILISLFEGSNDERLRDEYWKRIEAIGPNEDELKYLLDLGKARKLSRYIENLLAKRAKKKEGKAISKIKELIAQIKQGQA
jgi:hypothetical protein